MVEEDATDAQRTWARSDTVTVGLLVLGFVLLAFALNGTWHHWEGQSQGALAGAQEAEWHLDRVRLSGAGQAMWLDYDEDGLDQVGQTLDLTEAFLLVALVATAAAGVASAASRAGIRLPVVTPGRTRTAAGVAAAACVLGAALLVVTLPGAFAEDIGEPERFGREGDSPSDSFWGENADPQGALAWGPGTAWWAMLATSVPVGLAAWRLREPALEPGTLEPQPPARDPAPEPVAEPTHDPPLGPKAPAATRASGATGADGTIVFEMEIRPATEEETREREA